MGQILKNCDDELQFVSEFESTLNESPTDTDAVEAVRKVIETVKDMTNEDEKHDALLDLYKRSDGKVKELLTDLFKWWYKFVQKNEALSETEIFEEEDPKMKFKDQNQATRRSENEGEGQPNQAAKEQQGWSSSEIQPPATAAKQEQQEEKKRPQQHQNLQNQNSRCTSETQKIKQKAALKDKQINSEVRR